MFFSILDLNSKLLLLFLLFFFFLRIFDFFLLEVEEEDEIEKRQDEDEWSSGTEVDVYCEEEGEAVREGGDESGEEDWEEIY